MVHECKVLDSMINSLHGVVTYHGLGQSTIKRMRDSGFYKLDEQVISTTKTSTVTQNIYFNGMLIQIYNTVRVGRDTWDEEPRVINFRYCPFCGEPVTEKVARPADPHSICPCD